MRDASAAQNIATFAAIAFASLAAAAAWRMERARRAALLHHCVLASARQGWLALGRDGRCIAAGGRAGALLDTDAKQLNGKTAVEIFAAAADAGVRAEIERALAAPASAPAAVTAWLAASKCEVTVVDGGEVIVVWLREAPTPAATSRRTHDLVQPLGAIVNYAELSRSLSAAPVRDYADHIVRIAHQLAERLRHPPAADGDSAEAPPRPNLTRPPLDAPAED
jgi:hypothetical protein